MHDAFIVHVLESAGNLSHEFPYDGLIELQVIAFLILDELLQISSFGPFGDDDELIVVNEGIDELYDMWMAEFLHDFHLSKTLVALLLISHVKDLICDRRTLIFLRAKTTPCSFSAR